MSSHNTTPGPSPSALLARAGRAVRPSSLRGALFAATILAGGVGLVALAEAQTAARGVAGRPTPAPAQAAAPQAASSTGSSQNPAVTVLLERANFWRNQTQYDQALESLNRALVLEPANPDALALVGQIQADRGNRPAAEQALTRLRQSAPADPRIDKIDQSLKVGAIPQEALADARRLARDGRGPEAVDRYNRVLRGNPPPDSLAVEYYQTLAGTDGGWEKARDGLARVVRQNPQDLRAQLAYAQVLTYRDGARSDGISRLQALSQNPSVADQASQAWRQAVNWLPQDKSSIGDLSAYLSIHPNDPDVAKRLEDARNPPPDPNDPSAARRVTGFDQLNRGQLNEAATAFQSAIEVNANDADATGGLGVVRLRQRRFDEAKQLLNRAIQLNPATSGRWTAALRGVDQAIVGAQPNPATGLLARGNYAAAEAELRRQIAGGSGDQGLQMMLADAQAKQNENGAAEQTYRGVLARSPRYVPAMQGLAGILTKTGRNAEALPLLQQLAASGNGDPAALSQLRAQQLRADAAQVSDPATKAGLYRSAVAADPSNPWVRLDYARVLRSQGSLREARQVMADALAGRPSNDAIKAGILFANESGDPNAAAALLAQLPASARTPDLQQLQVSVELQRQIARVIDLPRTTARARLITLAAAPDPDGVRGATIARALSSIGDSSAARRAIIIARDSTPNQGSAARIAYAGALLDIGDAAGAQTMLAPLGYGGSLPPGEKQAFSQLRDGLAIKTADDLNQAGKQAAGYDRLAPALASDPDNSDMNLALARLYSGAKDPREALEINEALLRRDPANAEARRGAVAAALQSGNRRRASDLVREGLDIAPDDPKSWMASADYARATGNNARALRDLARARELRLQQLGYSDSGDDDSTLSHVTLAPGSAPITTRGAARVKYAPLGSKRAPGADMPVYAGADLGQDAPDPLAVPPGFTPGSPAGSRPTALAPVAPATALAPAAPGAAASTDQPRGRVLDTTQNDTLPAPRRLVQAAPAAVSNTAADSLNARELGGRPIPQVPSTYAAPAIAPPAIAPPTYAAPTYRPAAPVASAPYAAPGYSAPVYPPLARQASGAGQYVPPQYAQAQYAQAAPPYGNTYVPTYAQPQYVQPGAAPVYPGYLPAATQSGQPYAPPPPQVPPDQRYQPQVQEYLPQYRPAPPPSPGQQLLEDDAQFLRGNDFDKPYRPALPRINGDETVPFGRGTNDTGPTRFYDNPFRRSPDDATRASAGIPAGNGVSGPDPVTQEIDRNIVSLRDSLAPSVQGGFAFRLRSGDAGLDKLTEVSAPLVAVFSPGGAGKLTLAVTPINLNSGTLGGDDANKQRFGSLGAVLNPATNNGNVYTAASLPKGTPLPGTQKAQGVGLDVAYNNQFFTGDIGTTPVGFKVQNILGGVELAPRLTDRARLVLTAERRAMTDSVLSYSGTVDSRTGASWGGVVRNRGKAQLEFTAGSADFYVNGAGEQITGKHVAQNSEYEGGIGVSYPVLKQGDDEVRIGADLFYESYNKNLRFFTYGQGGYFSPQSYVSALVPITYRSKLEDDFSYEIGGAIGLQSFTEKSSNYYPIDPALQTQINAIPAFSGLSTTYPSRSSSGFAGNAHASFDYRASPNLHLIGSFAYQHSGDFDEAIGGVSAKYIFNGTAVR